MTSSTLLADPPSNETIDVFYINNDVEKAHFYVRGCKFAGSVTRRARNRWYWPEHPVLATHLSYNYCRSDLKTSQQLYRSIQWITANQIGLQNCTHPEFLSHPLVLFLPLPRELPIQVILLFAVFHLQLRLFIFILRKDTKQRIISQVTGHDYSNLMFLWPSIMNWLYVNYQLDALIIIYS